MPLSTLLRSLSSHRPATSTSTHDQNLHSTLSKHPISAIRLSTRTPAAYTEVLTSHNHYSSTLTHDSRTYTVPKCLEHCFEAGELRLMLWEMDDEIFEGALEKWRGGYVVWYIPAMGKFWLTKVREGQEGRVRYVDMPRVRVRDARWWFAREMADVRDRLVEVHGR